MIIKSFPRPAPSCRIARPRIFRLQKFRRLARLSTFPLTITPNRLQSRLFSKTFTEKHLELMRAGGRSENLSFGSRDVFGIMSSSGNGSYRKPPPFFPTPFSQRPTAPGRPRSPKKSVRSLSLSLLRLIGYRHQLSVSQQFLSATALCDLCAKKVFNRSSTFSLFFFSAISYRV